MSWERRGVAAVVAAQVSIVALHAAAMLQAASLGAPVGSAASAMVLPVLAAGVMSWWKPSWTASGLAAAATVVATGAMGSLPWAFGPLSILAGILLSVLASRIERALPASIDDAWERSRPKVLAWAALALLALAQVARLSVFMTDKESTWGSTFPPIEFTVGHMCMASYVHAADLSRQADPNLYAVEHYPNFGLTEAEDIETSVAGLQPYLHDSFHYPPPFLLLPRTWLALSNDYLVMRSLWFAFQLLSFVAFAVLLALWVGGSAGAWSLWMLPLVVSTMPTMFNLQFGQIHLFTIWTAMAAVLAFDEKRPVLGGLLLAGGIVSKLFPGILVLYLAFQKRWRDLAWTAVFGAAFTGLSLAVVGRAPFAQFFGYTLPRLLSGEAFSFATDPLVITTNLSVPGMVWKLNLLGVEGASEWLGPVSTVYTLLIVAATWYAARLTADRAGRARIWLMLLVLASLRSALVPIYGVAPVLWLMSLELDDVETTLGLVGFALSWLFISSVPPAPNPAVTIALYTVALLAMLYWVLRPLRHRSQSCPPSEPPVPSTA
ncbi:MAG: glycosyltransferase family 87 protein [Polyangiales bacterium]